MTGLAASEQRIEVGRRRRRVRPSHIVSRVAIYALLVLVSLIAVVPFLWMVSTSLKTAVEASSYPPSIWPTHPQWHDYVDVFGAAPFLTFFRNTVLYSACVTLGQLVFCSTAAFAFARLRFRFRNLLFVIYLATLMVPTVVTLIPSFILMKWLGWINTVWVMTIPGMTGSAFGTFLLRQFMLSIPKELDEAAIIEGASLFRIYRSVILPLVRSPLVVLTVLTVMTVWNDFAWPLVMLNSNSVMTLTLGLAVFETGGTEEYVNVPLAMAAATMVVAPLIVIFILAQRYFIRGFALSGFGGR